MGDGPSWFARENMQSMEKRNESTCLAGRDNSDVSLCARTQGMQREEERQLRPLGLAGAWARDKQAKIGSKMGLRREVPIELANRPDLGFDLGPTLGWDLGYCWSCFGL